MADFLDNERGMMVQVKKWKDKVLQYDKFLNVKGLVEEFKEFARPKSIKERMEVKQKNVKTQKQEQKMKPEQRKKRILLYKENKGYLSMM